MFISYSSTLTGKNLILRMICTYSLVYPKKTFRNAWGEKDLWRQSFEACTRQACGGTEVPYFPWNQGVLGPSPESLRVISSVSAVASSTVLCNCSNAGTGLRMQLWAWKAKDRLNHTRSEMSPGHQWALCKHYLLMPYDTTMNINIHILT